MDNPKLHPGLLRAVACAHLMGEPILEICREDAIDAYTHFRTDAGGGMRRAVAIRRDAVAVKNAADDLTRSHVEALERLASEREIEVFGLREAVSKSTPGMMVYWAREAAASRSPCAPSQAPPPR